MSDYVQECCACKTSFPKTQRRCPQCATLQPQLYAGLKCDKCQDGYIQQNSNYCALCGAPRDDTLLSASMVDYLMQHGLTGLRTEITDCAVTYASTVYAVMNKEPQRYGVAKAAWAIALCVVHTKLHKAHLSVYRICASQWTKLTNSPLTHEHFMDVAHQFRAMHESFTGKKAKELAGKRKEILAIVHQHFPDAELRLSLLPRVEKIKNKTQDEVQKVLEDSRCVKKLRKEQAAAPAQIA